MEVEADGCDLVQGVVQGELLLVDEAVHGGVDLFVGYEAFFEADGAEAAVGRVATELGVEDALVEELVVAEVAPAAHGEGVASDDLEVL